MNRIVYLTLLLAACILGVWTLVNRLTFDFYSLWDDEGNFVLTIRQFLKNGALYVKTYSQYGPFYALAESSLHRLFGLPVDLDGARILTVGCILCSGTLLSIFVGRLTRTLMPALSCFVLSAMITAPILSEPGHPQALIAVLVSLSLCISLLAGTRHENAGLILLGAVNAALMLTKINVGLFFCFALALSLAMTLVSGRFRSLILGLLVVGSVCMPPVLMAVYLKGWAWRFCLYILISLAALYIAAFQKATENPLRPIKIAFPLLGLAGMAVLIVAWAMATGSGPLALLSGSVIRPLRQPGIFYLGFTIPIWALMLSVLPVLGLSAIPFGRRRFPSFDHWLSIGKVAIALIAAAGFLGNLDLVMFYSLPLLPLLLVAPGIASAGLCETFPRLFLVSLIEFEMLQAYPVLATHHNALTASGAWICMLLYDGWSALVKLNPELAGFRSSPARSRATLGWLCVILTAPVLSWSLFTLPTQMGDTDMGRREILSRLISGRPIPPRSPLLNLPGSRLLHMRPAEAAIFRRLSGELHANCEMLFEMPGLGSLNIWSETPPPNGLNRDDWMVGLTAHEQEAIRMRLEHAGRPCVVYNPNLTRFWLHSGINLDPNAPMVDYVLHETKTVVVIGDYQIRVPFTRRAPWIAAVVR